MIRERTTNILIISTLILIGIGIIMVYSASSIFAQKRLGDSLYFLKKQAIFSMVGILLMSGVMKIKAKIYKNPYLVYFLLSLSFFLLALLLVPGIGFKKGGSMRWFRLGPLSFQPSEFSKLSLVIFLSYFLAKHRNEIKTFTKGFLIPFLVTGLLFLLILRQPDFGSGILLMAIMTMMLFVSGTRVRYLLSLSLILGVISSVLVMLAPYRLQRFIAFLDPWKDPKGVGFQIIQSTLAFASGGLWGRGLGNGMQKLFYLPEPHTDFILSVLGEEWGLLGLCLVILLFLILIVCGFRITVRTKDLNLQYLALGITALIGLQTIINMGVVIGLLPTKGLPLPFVSYGGSSLIINLIEVGILLSITSQSRWT